MRQPGLKRFVYNFVNCSNPIIIIVHIMIDSSYKKLSAQPRKNVVYS